MSRFVSIAIAAAATLALFSLLVAYIAGNVSGPAQLPILESGDFQLLIYSDKLDYKLGETPHITAQIINRSEHDIYFHNWSPKRPPGLEVFVTRPDDALPVDKWSEGSCRPLGSVNRWPYGWGGYAASFTHLHPGAIYPLKPCSQLSQGLFNSPGEYEIHIVYTNETESFETTLAKVGTSYINYTYTTGKQKGAWIPADADEFAAPPYEATERGLAISLGDKGPWIGEGEGRRRATLQEMLNRAPRITLTSKVLTIRVNKPLPYPEKMNQTTLRDYASDFLFPLARAGLPRHQRIVEKLEGLGEMAFPALEAVAAGSLSDEDRAYALSFFQLVPGDSAIPQRTARRIIENHLANQPSDGESLRDIVKATEILGEFGNTSSCTLLIDYLRREDDSASWAVFNTVKKLADEEMLRKFVEVLAQKAGYEHTGSLFDESILLWGEAVVIEVERELIEHGRANSKEATEQRRFSRALRALGKISARLKTMREHYESENLQSKELIDTEARDLLLKESSTLDSFNENWYFG